jgi:hypothetical protein
LSVQALDPIYYISFIEQYIYQTTSYPYTHYKKWIKTLKDLRDEPSMSSSQLAKKQKKIRKQLKNKGFYLN